MQFVVWNGCNVKNINTLPNYILTQKQVQVTQQVCWMLISPQELPKKLTNRLLKFLIQHDAEMQDIWFECKQKADETVSRKTWAGFEMKISLFLFPSLVFPESPNIILINMDDMGQVMTMGDRVLISCHLFIDYKLFWAKLFVATVFKANVCVSMSFSVNSRKK